MVSKFDHCLADLLYRWRIGELPMEPVAIVSNRPGEAIEHTPLGAIPFHHLPVTRDSKASQEAHVRELADLDEGPIIHQATEPISHADSRDELVRTGRDIESRVLAEAVRLHLEERVLLNGQRTVVFRN